MKKYSSAFTLAEVLITLGIIGIVASLTLPHLIKNYNGRILETQFKKAYATAAQVILLSKNELGVSYLAKHCADVAEDYESYEDGTTNGVEPYPNSSNCYTTLYKSLNKSSTSVNGWDKDKYTVERKDPIRTFNNKAEVSNGLGLAGAGNPWVMRQNRDGIWMQFRINEGKLYITFDVNGYKRPNQLGHDIFILYVDKKNDNITGIQQSKAYTDEELENEHFDKEYQQARAGNPCNKTSSQKANGIGCSWFAINDINPETGKAGYWKNLP